MVKTASLMNDLHSPLPSFLLLDPLTNEQVGVQDVMLHRGLVVYFICNHCPYVIHVQDSLVAVANDYLSKGVGFVAISANDPVGYPEDSPSAMAKVAKQQMYPFPYLFDETQSIARAFAASCTPDIFVYNADAQLYYRGQLDEARPGLDLSSDGGSLRVALNAMLAGEKADSFPQKPSLGCNIKWKQV